MSLLKIYQWRTNLIFVFVIFLMIYASEHGHYFLVIVEKFHNLNKQKNN